MKANLTLGVEEAQEALLVLEEAEALVGHGQLHSTRNRCQHESKVDSIS
jgi:hypothetical protein